jgi:hypothetical protein
MAFAHIVGLLAREAPRFYSENSAARTIARAWDRAMHTRWAS